MNDKPVTRNENSSQKSSEKSNSSDFSIDILAILNRRKGLVVLAGILGLIVGACYYLFLPPTFESKAQILLMQNDSGAIASNMQNGESISEDLLATHMSLVQSRRIVGDALKAAGLEELPSIVEKLDEDDTTTDYVIEHLYVTRGGSGSSRGARVLSIAFRHTVPEDCQAVVTAIVEQYRLFVESKFKDINEEAVRLINTARVELESEIEKLSEEYRAFKSDSPIMASTSGGPNIYAQRYEELAAKLSTLETSIDESRGRLDLVRSGLELLGTDEGRELEKLALIDERNAERLGILVTVDRGEAQTPEFLSLQPQRMANATAEASLILGLKAKLREATDEYGPNHPTVRTLETQLNEMQAFIDSREGKLGLDPNQKPLTPDDIMKAYVNLLENDLRALEKQKADLEKQMAQAEADAKSLISVELEDEAKLRELDRQEDLYNSVVERLRNINMQQDSTALIQEEIASPEVGERVSPKGSIAAAITLLTTMVTSGALILVAELRDNRIRTTQELESIYESRVLGQIPDFDSNAESRQQLRKSARSGSAISPQLFAFHDPQSRISEIFRGVRTQLLFSLNGINKVLAVTSPHQGDGKSTVTANLAISLAKASRSVLLIDCDMRRPSLHKAFGVPNKTGLVDALKSGSNLEALLLTPPCENLKLLTSGQVPENPAELLSSQGFRELLERVKKKYDFVILDCPPMLPVSDPAIIAPLVDRVVVVTGSNSMGVAEAEQCNRILNSVEARIGGVVVNRSGLPGSGYRYAEYDYQANA